MKKNVSEERKAFHAIGLIMVVSGLLLFFSVFVSGAMNFGDFTNFEERARSMGLRAVGGMALMMAGGVVAVIASQGLAGSGVVLDPEQARQDLEPHARMAGGVLKDVLDEADINLGGRPEQVIMIRCTACGRLNEEGSKFCQECGAAV